ncbi:astacin-like metalloendopeptidase [Pelodytes ibericus]
MGHGTTAPTLSPALTVSDIVPGRAEPANEDVPIFSMILKANKESKRPMKEGDIPLNLKRSAAKCASCRWPMSSNGRVNVPYTISSDFNKFQVNMIAAAMQEYELLTCVSFVPRTTEQDAISIISGVGCWSSVGRTGGIQELSVAGSSCMLNGIIQHELNHALGMLHESSRSDRDDYITIVTKYISPEYLSNFNKYDTDNLGLEYDYGSIMHLGRNDYSNTTGKDTIIPKLDTSIQLGQKVGLSPLDIAKMKKLYGCDVCSNLYTDPTGVITSSNASSAYPNNYSCVFFIRLPRFLISLQFQALHIRSSPDCAANYIKIYDGSSRSSPVLLDRVCGVQNLPPIISSNNKLLMEFVTNGQGTGSGFQASYSTVTCGGTFNAPSGKITSPQYPYPYDPSLNCSWAIMAPPGKKIKLTMAIFYLEYDVTCSHDSLSVYDGKDPSAPLLFRSCGLIMVPPIVSAGNTMLLQFKSNEAVETLGFKAFYTIKLYNRTICLDFLAPSRQIFVKPRTT